MVIKTRSFICMVVFVFFVFGPAASAVVYYVDGVNGSDLNSGLSPGQAFRTIGKGTSVAVSGDTINVFPAVYNERVVINQDNIHLEALPTATIAVTPTGGPLNRVGIEIDASTNNISANTVIRGFHIMGNLNNLDYGIYVHNRSGLDPRLVSPTIEGNTITGCQGVGIYIDVTWVIAAPSAPLIQHNLIKPGDHIMGDPITSSHPNAIGIRLESADNARLLAQVRSNQIYRCNYGIIVDDAACSRNDSEMMSNVIAYCHKGVDIRNGAFPTLTNDTVAFSMPNITSFQSVYGVISTNNQAWVRNAILWVPDIIDINGNVLFMGQDIVTASIDAFSIVEDFGGPYPQFAGPQGFDFHILSTSPAINAGDTSRVIPGAPNEVAYDLDGDPRILDPFRQGNLNVDLGADEYTTAGLDVILGYPLYGPAGPVGLPFVNLQINSPWGFTATGNPGDLFYYGLSVATMPPAYNVLISNYGNMLHPFTVTSPPMVIGPTGSLTMIYPSAFPGVLVDGEMDMQGVVIDPDNTIMGSFTRRILLDCNL